METYNEKTFEDIKHIDSIGNEYWLARELQRMAKVMQVKRIMKQPVKSEKQ